MKRYIVTEEELGRLRASAYSCGLYEGREDEVDAELDQRLEQAEVACRSRPVIKIAPGVYEDERLE